MQTNRPTRSISRTAVAAAVAVCALATARPSHGVPDTGLLMLDIDKLSSHRLDDLEKGELRITWRKDGPVLSLGELRTTTDSDRVYAKGSAAPPIEGCFLLAPFGFNGSGAIV